MPPITPRIGRWPATAGALALAVALGACGGHGRGHGDAGPADRQQPPDGQGNDPPAEAPGQEVGGDAGEAPAETPDGPRDLPPPVDKPPAEVPPGTECDKDKDGYKDVCCGGDDCDDLDPSVHPGAPDPPEAMAVWTVVDTGDKAGRHTSLRVDHRGKVHISYRQESAAGPNLVRYATNRCGGWSIRDVVDLGSDNWSYTSLDVEDDGTAHVAYYASAYADKHLKYAVGGLFAGFSTEFVDGSPDMYEWTGESPSLAVDPWGTVHIVYLAKNKKLLRHAARAPAGTSWIIEDVDGGSSTSWFGTGTSLRADGAGRLHATWEQSGLTYGVRDAGVWARAKVDATAGEYSSLVLAPDGAVDILYRGGAKAVGHARRTAGAIAFALESAASPDYEPFYVSAGRDPGGKLHAVYYLATSSDFFYLTNRAGSWEAKSWKEPGTDRGVDASLDVGPDGRVHVAHYDFDAHHLSHVVYDPGGNAVDQNCDGK